MAAWPGTLPQFVADDAYAEAPPDLVIRSPMEVGPAKLRRRGTAGVRPLAVELDLDTAQVATLDAFYVTTLNGGAEAFDWVNPRTQAVASLRFVRPPAYRPRSGDVCWRASLQLEILP